MMNLFKWALLAPPANKLPNLDCRARPNIKFLDLSLDLSN